MKLSFVIPAYNESANIGRCLDTVFREFSQDPRLVCLSGPFIYYDAPRSVRFWTRLFYLAGFVTYLVNRFVLGAGSMVQGGNFICRRSALEDV